MEIQRRPPYPGKAAHNSLEISAGAATKSVHHAQEKLAALCLQSAIPDTLLLLEVRLQCLMVAFPLWT